MPSFFPENNTVLASDGELRTLMKIADLAGGGGGGGGSGLTWSSGTGAPEGAVVGSPGDRYWDTDTAFEYVKITGTATNTGWSIH